MASSPAPSSSQTPNASTTTVTAAASTTTDKLVAAGPASKAGASQIKRGHAPSLSQLVNTLKSHNPEKWEKLSNTVGPADPAGRHGGKVQDASSTTGSIAGAAEVVSNDANTGSQGQGKTAPTDDPDASAPSTSAPRLRLPARLGSVSSGGAPALVRSNSSSAAIPSSSSSGLLSVLKPSGGSSTLSAGTGVPTPPSPVSMSRRGSAAGVPSLEDIEKRFAIKKEKERERAKEIEALAASVSSVGMSRANTDGSATSAASSVNTASSVVSELGLGSIDMDSRSSSMTSNASSLSDGFLGGKAHLLPTTGKKDLPTTSSLSLAIPSGHIAQAQAVATSPTSCLAKITEADENEPTTARANTLNPLKTDEPLLPLQHSWTLYYDSKATAAAARARTKASTTTAASGATAATPTSATATSAANAGWEASLSTIGTFGTVQSFCRLFNWLKKPSRMGMAENLHFFKDGIRPMWEDPANRMGGKWTLNLDWAAKEQVDRVWLWLCLALIGEDFDGKDDAICGCVISTRPRLYRIQVWLRTRDDVPVINAIGERLIALLELDPARARAPPSPTSGSMRMANVSLEFGAHSHTGRGGASNTGVAVQANFISIQPTKPLPPSSVFNTFPGNSVNGNGSGASESKILAPANAAAISQFNRPGGFGGSANHPTPPGLVRANTLSSLPSYAAVGAKADMGGLGAEKSVGSQMSWRERLGQGKKQAV